MGDPDGPGARRRRRALSPARAPDDLVLLPPDPMYPDAFLPARGGPPVPIVVRGHGPWPARPAVAVVGARNATPYAGRVARDVAAACARAGVAVVSGLARGVDAAAHEAALEHGGTTVAVLGTGVDTVYPPEHGALAAAIRRHGRLVSAFPDDAPPRRAHFPARNRLVAALSVGVVVVQADADSGTRHTVRAVLAQGGWARIAPWPLGDARYEGNAAWMARAAGGDARLGILTDAGQPAREALESAEPADDPAGKLVAAAGSRFRPLDALARAAGLSAGEAAAAALGLELAGVLESASGDRWRRRPA